MRLVAYAYRKTCFELLVFLLCAAFLVPNAYSALRQIDLSEYTFLATANSELTSYDIGDVDGDGIDDVALTDVEDATEGEGAGAVYIFLADSLLGSSSEEINVAHADKTYFGTAGESLGVKVTALGDTDGDGLDDFTIGTAENDQAYLVLGAMLVTADNDVDTDSTVTSNTDPRAAVVSVGIGISEDIGCSLRPGFSVHGNVLSWGIVLAFLPLLILFRLRAAKSHQACW